MAVTSLIISIISLVISGILLSISWRKNVKDRQYSNDKELLEQLKQSLDLAYHSLAPDGDRPPINNRLRWLTSARHIVRYRQISNSLNTPLYRTICEEQEEYWRNRFYILLGKIDSSGYYEAINPDEMVPENIEPRSAAIVHSFSVWKEGRSDPLEDMSFEDIVRNYKLFSPLHLHFREYIKRKYPNLADKVNEKR